MAKIQFAPSREFGAFAASAVTQWARGGLKYNILDLRWVLWGIAARGPVRYCCEGGESREACVWRYWSAFVRIMTLVGDSLGGRDGLLLAVLSLCRQRLLPG